MLSRAAKLRSKMMYPPEIFARSIMSKYVFRILIVFGHVIIVFALFSARYFSSAKLRSLLFGCLFGCRTVASVGGARVAIIR